MPTIGELRRKFNALDKKLFKSDNNETRSKAEKIVVRNLIDKQKKGIIIEIVALENKIARANQRFQPKLNF